MITKRSDKLEVGDVVTYRDDDVPHPATYRGTVIRVDTPKMGAVRFVTANQDGHRSFIAGSGFRFRVNKHQASPAKIAALQTICGSPSLGETN